MFQTIFKISGLDCPSEERLIRLKLNDLQAIHQLSFDIPNRSLTVFHSNHPEAVLRELDALNLGTTLLVSIPAGETPVTDTGNDERRLLRKVLMINFFFFTLEIGAGFFSRSMGLVADSLDMLADAIVYGLALWAVSGTVSVKKNVARAAGFLQVMLSFLGLAEVIRRFLMPEPVPVFQTMIIISMLALAGNAFSLYLLQKSKSNEAHMKASLIFTSNDVIVNLGVILAGGMVWLTRSGFPDLLIGGIVFILVFRGALKILNLSKHQKNNGK